MLNYPNKIFAKSISLILAQIFLLTCVACPEVISNKDTSGVYIKDKTLRVPLDSPNGYSRMRKAADGIVSAAQSAAKQSSAEQALASNASLLKMAPLFFISFMPIASMMSQPAQNIPKDTMGVVQAGVASIETMTIQDDMNKLMANAAKGDMESLAKLDKLADNDSQGARDAFKNADLKDLISQLKYQFDKDKIRALMVFAVYGNPYAANFFAVLNPADYIENSALKEMFIQRDFKGLRTLIETTTDTKALDQILLDIEASFIAKKSEVIQSEDASLIISAIVTRHNELVSLATVHALVSTLNEQKNSWVPYFTLKEIIEGRSDLVSKRMLWTLLNIFAKGEAGSWNRNVPKLIWDIAKNRPDLVSDTVIKEFTSAIFTVGKIRYLLPGIYVDAAEAIQELVKKRPQLRQDELINKLVHVPIGIIAQGGYEEYFQILSYINNTYPDLGSLAEKHSIALAAFRFLERFGELDISSTDMIKEIVDIIIQKRKEYFDIEVFGYSTDKIINILHGSYRGRYDETMRLQEGTGVDTSRISFFIGHEKKQAILRSISDSKGSLTIFIQNHGNPYRFSLDDPSSSAIGLVTEDFLLAPILNPIISIVTGENANIFSISEKELGKALLKREQKGELGKIVIILDACYSYDFASYGLLEYLSREGAKNFPIVISSANKGKLSWGAGLLNAFRDIQQGKQRGSPFTMGDVFKAEKKTIEQSFDTSEDFGIFIPFSMEELERLRQKLGLPEENKKFRRVFQKSVPVLEIGDATVPNQRQGFSSDDLSGAPYSNPIHGPMVSPAVENIGIADTPKTRQDVSMDSQISLLLDKARKGTKRTEVIDAVNKLYYLAMSKDNIKAQDALVSLAEEGENMSVNCVYLLASSGDYPRLKEIVKTLYSPQLIEKARKGDEAAAWRLSDLTRLGNAKAQEELINLVREGKNNAVQPLCFVAVSKYGARAKEFLETLDLAQFVEQAKQGSHKAIESLYFLVYYDTSPKAQGALLKLLATISGVKNHVYYDITDRILDIVINKASFPELRDQELLDTIKTNFKKSFSHMKFKPGENSPEIRGIVSRAIDLFGSKAIKDASKPIQEEFKRSPQRILFYLSMPEVVYPLLKAYQRSGPNKDIPFSYFVSAAFAEGYINYGVAIMSGNTMTFDVVGPMGLDSFGAQEKALKRKGFLPEDFQGFASSDTTYTNEAGETYPNGTFASAEDALVAFMALLRESMARYLTDVRSLGHKVQELSEDAIMVGTYLYYCTSNPKSYLKQYGVNLKGVVGKYPRHGNGLFNSQWPAGTTRLLEKLIPEINSIGERNNDSGLLPNESENRLEGLESQLTTRDGLANQLDMYKLKEAYFELIKQGKLSWSEITKRTERLHGAIAREILKDLQRDLAAEQDATEQALTSNASVERRETLLSETSKALREAI